MKAALTQLALGTLLVTTLPSLSLTSSLPAQAAVNFGQQEVNQERFVIVALPRNQGGYSLMILEQLSNQRLCWQQNNDPAQTVNLLLLKFNFTRICGRSTDSNSYSLRMAGQDLGLVYTLRLVSRNGVLVLVGTPSRRTLPEVEIGRTRGLVAEPMRIDLNPGWRLAKRTFKNTVVGHVYFATDTDLSTIAAQTAQPAPPPTPTVPRVPPTQPAPPIPPAPEVSPTPPSPVTVTPPPPVTVTPPPRTPIVVPPPRTPAPVTPAPPTAPRLPQPTPQPTPPPTNTAADDVNQIYREFLGRDADPAGLSFYVGRLNQGLPLEDIRRAIANSPEAKARQQAQTPPVAATPVQPPAQPIMVPPPSSPPVTAPAPPPPITTPAPTPAIATGLNSTSAYFVVVPSSETNLAAIARQVWQLGVAWKDITQRDEPRGPHIAVGPFGQRGAAEQMSTYLRGYGLDARVYFGR